jgi:hypothetical protein
MVRTALKNKVNRLWAACLKNLDSVPRRGMKFVSSPKYRDHLRAHCALYMVGAMGLFIWGKIARS